MARASQPLPHVYILSGPSGSGKTTLCREAALRHNWYYSISHTTRQKRTFEKDGQDYFFVSRKEFEAMVAADDFLEWALVYDHLYGTSKKKIEEALSQGFSVILDVDTQGALKIKKRMPEATLIFVKPPDLNALRERLTTRAGDSAEEIKKRLSHAHNEMQFQSQYDYTIINDDLEKATRELENIFKKT
jgi:guanylate kinase